MSWSNARGEKPSRKRSITFCRIRLWSKIFCRNWHSGASGSSKWKGVSTIRMRRGNQYRHRSWVNGTVPASFQSRSAATRSSKAAGRVMSGLWPGSSPISNAAPHWCRLSWKAWVRWYKADLPERCQRQRAGWRRACPEVVRKGYR